MYCVAAEAAGLVAPLVVTAAPHHSNGVAQDGEDDFHALGDGLHAAGQVDDERAAANACTAPRQDGIGGFPVAFGS